MKILTMIDKNNSGMKTTEMTNTQYKQKAVKCLIGAVLARFNFILV